MQIHLINSLASASGCLCAMLSRDLTGIHNRFPSLKSTIQSIQTPLALLLVTCQPVSCSVPNGVTRAKARP